MSSDVSECDTEQRCSDTDEPRSAVSADAGEEQDLIFLTILICSSGRPTGLLTTLRSVFSPSNAALAGWEAIVITRDEEKTVAVCRQFQSQYPDRFRFFLQPGAGKSEALNLGIAEARGELLALTDDDVVVAADYICSIRETFGHHPFDGAQGRIFLECPGGLPEWMSSHHVKFMSKRDLGEQIEPFHETLSGTNMVVRTDAARAVGGFSLELGAGTSVGFAEDTEFSIRLQKAGYSFIYAPRIVVRHQLPEHRLTRSFFRTRYFRLGRSHAYYDLPPVPLWRFGLYAAKNWIIREAQAFRYRIAKQPAKALDCQCEARLQAGLFFQHLLFFLGTPRQLTRVTRWSDANGNRGHN